MIQESHDHLQVKTDVLGQNKRKITFFVHPGISEALEMSLFVLTEGTRTQFFFKGKLTNQMRGIFKKSIKKCGNGGLQAQSPFML